MKPPRPGTLAAAALALCLAGCFTPIQKAVLQGDTGRVKELLSAGIDVNQRGTHATTNGGTLLHFAAKLGDEEMARFLLASGADANLKDDGGDTPFDVAVGYREPKIAQLLKEWQVRKSTPTAAAPQNILSREEIERIVAAELAARSKAGQPAAVRSDVDAPAYRLAERPDDFALVIGVEKYQGLPDAQFARRDAEAMRDHLLALGYPQRNVVLLADSQATKTNLAKYLEAWLPDNVSERSTVFFFYSGHGAPDAKSGRAYIVPVEGDPQYLEVSAYPLEQLYRKLGALKARRVYVALDSCFSGAGGRSVLPKGTRPLVTKVDTGALDPGGKVVAMTASSAEEISGTLAEQGHGAFTYYLLKGLNGAAAKGGAVTVRALFDYLKPKVEDAARQQNRDQTPALLPKGLDADGLRLR